MSSFKRHVKHTHVYDPFIQKQAQYSLPEFNLTEEIVSVERNCLVCERKFTADSKFIRSCKLCKENQATLYFHL